MITPMLAGERTSNKILPTYPTSLVVSVTSPLVEDYQWASPQKKTAEKEQRKKHVHIEVNSMSQVVPSAYRRIAPLQSLANHCIYH